MVCRRKMVRESSQLSQVSVVIHVTLAAVAFGRLWKPPGHYLWQLQALDVSWTNLGESRQRRTALLYLIMYFLTSHCWVGCHPVKKYFTSKPFIRTPN